MLKKLDLLHLILFIANILILVCGLVFFLIKWSSLPTEVGIHFGPDGNFDVVASKVYGFYPDIIGGIIIAGTAAANRIIKKKKLGLRINEKGEEIFKTELRLTLDLIVMLFMTFFALWSYSVGTQKPYSSAIFNLISTILLLLAGIGITAQVITFCRHRVKEKAAKDTLLFHRLCRLIAWLMTAGGLWMLAEAWDRHPADEELYFDPDYYGLAYFANIGEFLDKRLLAIPHIIVIVLLAVLEIISAKAMKAEKKPLVALTDKLKLIFGLFFFWFNLLLESETSVGIVSVSLFVILCVVSFVVYFISRSKKTSPQSDT